MLDRVSGLPGRWGRTLSDGWISCRKARLDLDATARCPNGIAAARGGNATGRPRPPPLESPLLLADPCHEVLGFVRGHEIL